MDGASAPNGLGPQANGPPNQQPSHSQTPLLRIPSVREALPFTPFSSIVPFNPEHITPALAIPSTTPTAFDYSEDIQKSRAELERLSRGAQQAEDASKRCQQTLRDVQRLLDPESIAEFKFKVTKKRKPADSNTPAKQPELSSFAKMVLDNTDVAYRYLTPDSDGDTSAVKKTQYEKAARPEHEDTIAVESRQRAPEVQPTPDLHAQSTPVQPFQSTPDQPARSDLLLPQNQQSQRQHSGIAYVQLPRQPPAPQSLAGLLSSQQTAPAPSQPTPTAIVVPAKLTPAQLAEYQRVSAASDERDTTPSRNQSAYLTNGSRAVSLDQRLKADQAVETLQSLLHDIFAAEDRLEPDTSGDVSMTTNAFFTTRELDAGTVPTLRADVQARLETAIQKVVGHGRIDSIEVEHLSRAQKLCEGAVAAVGSALLEIGDDWQEQDIQDWLLRVENLQNSLIATRTMMRIMTGGSHHRELQSEDYLREILEATRSVVERCILPIVESRPQLGEKIKGEKNAPRNVRFDLATEHKKPLLSVVSAVTRCFKILGDLFVKIDMDESSVSNVEYTCKALLFAQNAAADKESALGIQAFEKLRVSAMDVISRIFTKYTSQRTFIISEILLSLEKLPATKQSARQFQLPDAKPIQLVSALLMRLVQTSATTTTVALDIDDEDQDEKPEIDDSEEEDSDDSEDNIHVSAKKATSKSKPKSQHRDLRSVYEPLKEASQSHASQIVSMLLQRALLTSKSSTDEPFRKLLDIFVDDFINVLGSSDWPAAEVLLRVLVSHLVNFAENAKKPAPTRTLALEFLGVIGSGILDIQSSTINAAKALESDSPMSSVLAEVVGTIARGDLASPAITAFDGPYRIVLAYLHARGLDNNPQLQTARGYHLVQWADMVCTVRASSVGDGDGGDSAYRELQTKIRHMIEDVQWLEDNTQGVAPSTTQGKLAAKVLASTSLLARAFNRIFHVVLQSMTSEQPTVRSRALKSVTTLLEQDPSVLDRNTQVLAQILRCLSDPSPLVRDSALGLVQKCVSLRPAIELKVYEKIIARTTDANQNVRKRSMAFLKQVYLRHNDNRIRAAISNALITRVKDAEESVAEVALTTIEEVWFSAFKGADSDNGVDAALQLQSHARLIIQTVELGDNLAIVLRDLIKNLLTKSKQKGDNFKICKLFVSTLFGGVIDKEQFPEKIQQIPILHALEVFAKAAPKLFTVAQIDHLVIYTENIATSEDLDLFRSSVTILRFTLPVLTGFNKDAMSTIQASLLKYASKIQRSELSVAAPCIQAIGEILGQKNQAIVLVRKALENVNNKRDQDLNNDKTNIVGRLLTIIGQMGKACNFENDLTAFKSVFPHFKGKSVASLMVEICCHFTSPRQPLIPREAALEAVCEICQSFPDNFLRADVVNAMEAVFRDRETTLEGALLASLEGFFAKEEDDAEASEILGTGIESGAQRLGGTYQAKGHDSASASLSQRFLQDFLRIALSSIDENALCAARIVGWINERGMAHPGESAPGLVALQSCPGSAIAKLAFTAYMQQYTKHENVFEKTLVKSVQQAFDYQQRVVKSASGYTGQPPTSKLHFFWQTLKSGKAKVRTKFFTNICLAMDFDPAKLNLAGSSPQHLMFVRFCLENLAFLEYERADEVVHLLSCLEKIFAVTGTAVVQAIESEVLNLQVPVSSTQMANGDTSIAASIEAVVQPANPAIDSTRLQQLAVSSQILSLMWETRSYLRKLWNLQKYASKQKGAKEPVKLTRATNSPALTENYLGKINKFMALESDDEARRGMCIAFEKLFSVDNEVKVDDEEAEEDEIRYDDGTDARSEGSSGKSPSVGAAPRGKKRKSVDGGGGKSKKRARKSASAKLEQDEDGDWL